MKKFTRKKRKRGHIQIHENLVIHVPLPTGVMIMNKQELIPLEVVKGRPFELLLDATLKSLKRESTYMSKEASHLLTKPGLLALIESFEPEDSIELLLILQFLIGYLWGAEKLSVGYKFETFTNLSLRAGDLLIRYKAIKQKKAVKKAIPHEQPDIDAKP